MTASFTADAQGTFVFPDDTAERLFESDAPASAGDRVARARSSPGPDA